MKPRPLRSDPHPLERIRIRSKASSAAPGRSAAQQLRSASAPLRFAPPRSLPLRSRSCPRRAYSTARRRRADPRPLRRVRVCSGQIRVRPDRSASVRTAPRPPGTDPRPHVTDPRPVVFDPRPVGFYARPLVRDPRRVFHNIRRFGSDSPADSRISPAAAVSRFGRVGCDKAQRESRPTAPCATRWHQVEPSRSLQFASLSVGMTPTQLPGYLRSTPYRLSSVRSSGIMSSRSGSCATLSENWITSTFVGLPVRM